ncbi:MAG: GTP-binding protein [Nanoarchaeota archaeon]|nr:GTP-binding protein [Nanoarchaeota archaeon]
MMLKIGVDAIDDFFKQIKTNLLIISSPSVDSSSFMQHLLCVSQGEKTYVVNNKTINVVKNNILSLGYGFDNINLVDSYSGVICPTKENINPEDVSRALKGVKDSLLFYDSISTLFNLSEKPFERIKELIKKAKENNCILVTNFINWNFSKEFLNKLISMFDNVVLLNSIESKIFLTSYLEFLKKPLNLRIPFKILKPGGFKVYIPKILVTGPFNAGKTSFVHSASKRAVSVDRLGTTVALDHGIVDYKGFLVDLFGTPGQERFDPLLKMLSSEALGVILVIDSTAPQTFKRAKEMLIKTRKEGLPVVIAANKSNSKNALCSKEILEKLDLKDVDVIPIDVADGETPTRGKPCKLKNVNIVLEALFNKILGDGNVKERRT